MGIFDSILGSSGVGSAIGGLFNYLGTEQTNQSNQQMLAQQEAYQTQMSNTAYQRATADMTKAGLNPMMMFGSGGPSSSPSAPSSPPRVSPMSSIGQSVNSAVNNMVQSKTIDKMTEEIAKLNEEKWKTMSERINIIPAQADALKAQADTARATGRATIAGIPAIEAKSHIEDIMSKLWDDPVFGKVLRGGPIGKAASDMIAPGSEIVGGMFKGLLGGSAARIARDKSEMDKARVDSQIGTDFSKRWP